MAAGDTLFHDQFCVDLWKKLHAIHASDVIKLGIITNAVTPAVTDADPRWGAGGTTNYSTNEVAAGGNYAAGGPTIANCAVTLTGGLAMFDGDDITVAQNASNPTNARWGIIYNSTDAGKRVLGFIDFGAVFDMTTGPLQINWNANGLARLNN